MKKIRLISVVIVIFCIFTGACWAGENSKPYTGTEFPSDKQLAEACDTLLSAVHPFSDPAHKATIVGKRQRSFAVVGQVPQSYAVIEIFFQRPDVPAVMGAILRHLDSGVWVLGVWNSKGFFLPSVVVQGK